MFKLKYRKQIYEYSDGNIENIESVINFKSVVDRIIIINFFKEKEKINDLNKILNDNHEVIIDLDDIIESYLLSSGIPIFYGIENIQTVEGFPINLLGGITAIDAESGNLEVTYKIETLNKEEITLDEAINNIGEYKVTYSAIDGKNNKIEETCALYVNGNLSYNFPNRIDLRQKPIVYQPIVYFNYVNYKNELIRVEPTNVVHSINQNIIGKNEVYYIGTHPVNNYKVNIKQEIFIHSNIIITVNEIFKKVQGTFSKDDLENWFRLNVKAFITNINDDGSESNDYVPYSYILPNNFDVNKPGIYSATINAKSTIDEVDSLRTTIDLRILEGSKPIIIPNNEDIRVVENHPVDLRARVAIDNDDYKDLTKINYIIYNSENIQVSENDMYSKIGKYKITFTYTAINGGQANPITQNLYVYGDINRSATKDEVHSRVDSQLPTIARFTYYDVLNETNKEISFLYIVDGIKYAKLNVNEPIKYNIEYEVIHPINENVKMNLLQTLYIHGNPFIKFNEYDKYVFKNDTNFDIHEYMDSITAFVTYVNEDGTLFERQLDIDFSFTPAFNLNLTNTYRLSMYTYDVYKGTRSEAIEFINIHVVPTNQPVLSSDYDVNIVLHDDVDLMDGVHSHDVLDGTDFGELSLKIFNSDGVQILKEEALSNIGIYTLKYTIKNSQNVSSEPLTRYLRINGPILFKKTDRIDLRQGDGLYSLQNDFHYYDVAAEKEIYLTLDNLLVNNEHRNTVDRNIIQLNRVEYSYTHPVNKTKNVFIQNIYVHGNPVVKVKEENKTLIVGDDFDINDYIYTENVDIEIRKVKDDGSVYLETRKPDKYNSVPKFNINSDNKYRISILVYDEIYDSIISYYRDLYITVLKSKVPTITINGGDIELVIGDNVNLLADVTCTDPEEGILPVEYKIIQTHNNEEITLENALKNINEYLVVYSASDSTKNKAVEVTRYLRVYGEIYLKDYEITTPFDRIDVRVNESASYPLMSNLRIVYYYEDYKHDIIEVPVEYTAPYINTIPTYTIPLDTPKKVIVNWTTTHPINSLHKDIKDLEFYVQGNPYIVVNEPDKFVIKGNPTFIFDDFIKLTKAYVEHVLNSGIVYTEELPVSHSCIPIFDINKLNTYYITYTASDKWRDSIVTTTSKTTLKVHNGRPITVEGYHIHIGNLLQLDNVIINSNSVQQGIPSPDFPKKINHHGIESKNKVRLTEISNNETKEYFIRGDNYIEINRSIQNNFNTKDSFRPTIDFNLDLIDRYNLEQEYYLIIEILGNTTGSDFTINQYQSEDSMTLFNKVGSLVTIKSHETKKLIACDLMTLHPNLTTFNGIINLFEVNIPESVLSGKITLRYSVFKKEEIYHIDELIYLPFIEGYNKAGFVIKLPDGTLIDQTFNVYDYGLKHSPNEEVMESIKIDYGEENVTYTQNFNTRILNGQNADESGFDYLIIDPDSSLPQKNTNGNGWSLLENYCSKSTYAFYMKLDDLVGYKDKNTIWCDSFNDGYTEHFEDGDECIFQDTVTWTSNNYDGTTETITLPVIGLRINKNRLDYAGDPFDYNNKTITEAFMVWIQSHPIKIYYPCNAMYMYPISNEFREIDLKGFSNIQIISPLSINTIFTVTYFTNDGPMVSTEYDKTVGISASYKEGVHEITKINYDDLTVVKYDSNYNYKTLGVIKSTEIVNIIVTPTIENDTKYPWSKDVDGIYQPSNKGVNSSSSTINFKFDITETLNLRFDWSASSESSSYDYVYYTITKDGSTMNGTGTSTKIGGNIYPTFYTVEKVLAPGSYILTFVYKKDISSHKYNDTAYIRDLEISGSVERETLVPEYSLDRETFDETGVYTIGVTYVEDD